MQVVSARRDHAGSDGRKRMAGLIPLGCVVSAHLDLPINTPSGLPGNRTPESFVSTIPLATVVGVKENVFYPFRPGIYMRATIYARARSLHRQHRHHKGWWR